MRTTLNIAEDVLHAARERACREGRSIGEVISDLARASLAAQQSERPGSHCGIRPFPRRGNVVTNELVDKLRDGDTHG